MFPQGVSGFWSEVVGGTFYGRNDRREISEPPVLGGARGRHLRGQLCACAGRFDLKEGAFVVNDNTRKALKHKHLI